MPIYRMTSDKLEQIPATSFAQENIMERGDLQRLLRAQPDVLEEGLFIITEEFGNWQDSNRRIDLLGLDSAGRLVVVELKRGDTGNHMDLQAIRYAAMVSVFTSDDLLEAHQAHLDKWRIEGDARERIRQHLANTDFEEIYTATPRVILVSEGSSNELTTSALWLNNNGLDITCIQLQPYLNGSELLVESSQVVSVPGTEDLLVQAQNKNNETKKQRFSKSERLPGGEAFEKRIESAPEKFRPDLGRIYSWAVDLEQEKLAELSTYANGKRDYFRLDLRVPGKGQPLVSPSNIVNKRVEIAFWLDNFENLAPKAMPQVDELVKFTNAVGKMNYRTLANIPNLDTLLAVLTDAYQEANGIAPVVSVSED